LRRSLSAGFGSLISTDKPPQTSVAVTTAPPLSVILPRRTLRDSGAAVLLGGQRTVLGLHLGGSRDDEIGVFQPIGPIFRRHGLELMSGKGVD